MDYLEPDPGREAFLYGALKLAAASAPGSSTLTEIVASPLPPSSA
jgi:hypothetical protein